MYNHKAVIFDMDGTIITNTNSVRFLCEINGKEKEVKKIEKLEASNKISWVEADFKKAELIKGLNTKKIKTEFDRKIKLIGKLKNTLNYLKELKIKTALITVGPIQVACELKKRFDFDEVYGSNYEVENNVFTGEILKHLGAGGKVDCLINFCKSINVSPNDCIAVGDSESDIEVFKKCNKAIAINYSNIIMDKADYYLNSDSIKDILKYI